MQKFTLTSSFKPAGDQPQAIKALVEGLNDRRTEQVLVGVTGSGKTYTMAQVISKIQKPTLILSHNKTLAAQLYQEFRDFFPTNAVSYFVSYYDYYQPEAYLPRTDTYIEKETEINEEIDKLRLAATTNLLTRKDTIIVSSVSCIYNIGSPREYGHFVLELKTGMKVNRPSILERLIVLQYARSDFGFHRGTFRVRGESIDLIPAYSDKAIRMILNNKHLLKLESIDPLTGKVHETVNSVVIYPAKHYMTDPQKHQSVFGQIKYDLNLQVKNFKNQNKMIEASRIEQRVNYDLEMIEEMGYVNGIENYSRYFDGRTSGDPPFTLFDYYEEAAGKDWLLIIDESHMSVPQIRGMYHGDRTRKQTLIDYGFRLPSALDNRPLRFEEFLRIKPQTIYVSATPSEWEISRAEQFGKSGIVEQLVRPTGLVDPKIYLKPARNQVQDLILEIQKRIKRHERILVTTLTKRTAEDLSKHLEELGIKVNYLHSDIQTLKRTEIIASLRLGTFDVIVGINLLREGLDLPEVSLVAILDADKEGFLRNRISLIQTMGRAARHLRGEVILYADKITQSIKQAVEEVERRRKIQIAYNQKYNINPVTIEKPIRSKLVEEIENQNDLYDRSLTIDKLANMTPFDKFEFKKKMNKQMRQASKDLNFELAAKLRDLIATIN